MPANRPVHPAHFIAWTILRGQARSYRDLVLTVVLRHPATPWKHRDARRMSGKNARECTGRTSICGSALAREQAGASDTFCRLYRLFAGKRASTECVLAERANPAKRPEFGLTRHTPDSAPASVRSRAGLAVCARCSFRPDPCRLYRRRSIAPADGRSTSR